jgi:hypothetical protein
MKTADSKRWQRSRFVQPSVKGSLRFPFHRKARLSSPLFATTPGAPASQMSATALIALEQTPQLDEDHASHG